MSFMSTIPNDLIAHTAAQAAVMESMYAEIDFWRKFADSNPTGGSRKRRAEAEEMLAMNEKLKEFQAEVCLCLFTLIYLSQRVRIIINKSGFDTKKSTPRRKGSLKRISGRTQQQ